MGLRKFRLRNAKGSPFELWVGTVAVLNAVFFFANPDANPIHDLVAPWDWVWAITYGLAGLFIVVGLLRDRSSQIEAVGLVFLIGGLVIQLVVFASMGVPTLIGTVGTLLSLSTLLALALWRVRILLKASKVVDDR